MEQLREYADMKMLMTAAKEMEKDMKAVVDAEFQARYLEDGTKTRDVLENDEKLASLTWVPGTSPQLEDVLAVDDSEALYAWCSERGLLAPDMEAVMQHLADTGELPDGCAVTQKPTGGKSGYVKVTSSKSYKRQFTDKARKLLGGA